MRLILTIGFLVSSLCRAEWQELAEWLENISKTEMHAFGLRDLDGRTMDCLEVFQPKGRFELYGVYHTLKNGEFSVHLAKSQDLKTWEHVTKLDQRASQASIHEVEDGSFLLAYEKDAPNSCWLKIRHYEDLEALRKGKFRKAFDIGRSLAPTAEGTPSIESVTMPGGDLFRSTINLRFHYFERARVDQLAFGTLTGFKEWKAAPSKKLNKAFQELGGKGNLGDRDSLIWRGKKYYLQEVQGKVGDWGSWRVYLCDAEGMPLQKLNFKTPKDAKAFSNPSVSVIRTLPGEEKFVFSAYIHAKGTEPGEIGQFFSVFSDR